MIVHKVAGPPGTGKTQTLAAQAKRAAEKYGADRVMITSFTRAGAMEIADRADGIKLSGTLHSIAWRALGRPKIAEANVGSWNEAHPSLSISAKGESLAELESARRSPGDKLLSSVNILRAQMIPEGQWPPNELAFWRTWQDWMAENDYIDFTGVLEKALKVLPYAPGAPRVLFHDESQDSTRLQWRLLRQWASQADYLVSAGDDDQALYSWLGATVDEFIAPVSGETRVLGQSWRCPAAVAEVATAYAEANIRERMAKHWLPRDGSEGTVTRSHLRWRDGEAVAKEIIDTDSTVMVLASAGYMLAPLIKALRERGELFWNPYRSDRGDWNPIRLEAERVTTWQRLLAFMRPHTEATLWTVGDVRLWLPMVKRRGIVSGGLDVLAEHPADEFMTPDLLDAVFEDWQGPLNGGAEWLSEHALAEKQRALAYPMRVLAKRSAAAFSASPRLIVGTVHSVKGGEAERVYLFPDLSMSAQQQMVRDADPFHRLAYVGMTRAREDLVLCAPSNPGGFRW